MKFYIETIPQATGLVLEKPLKILLPI